jgi:hypothetical protein
MWSLMAPERSWEGSGWAWELQSRLWGPPGGSRGKGFGPWRAPGGAQNAKNAILEPLSFFPKRSRAYIYSGFSVFLKKHVFFKFGSDGFSRGAREGPETCVWPLRNFQGGPRKSGSGPRGPFLGGPGSAKVRQGFNFEVNPGLVLTFSFFALNDFWKVPRGSPERGAEQQQFQRGAEGGGSNSLWGPEGGPKTKRDPRQSPVRPVPDRTGRKRRPRAPGKTIVKDPQTLTGRRTRRIYHALGRWPGEFCMLV